MGVSDALGGVVDANGLLLLRVGVGLLTVGGGAVVEHAWQAGHEIVWDDVEILDTATELQERKVKESVYIRLAPKGCRMNRDDGRELSPLWIRTITNALKKEPIYKPRPPREPRPRDNRPLPRVRRRANATSPAPIRPTPPEAPPPTVRRPTPNSQKKKAVGVDHVPKSIGHTHRRSDYLRTVHL